MPEKKSGRVFPPYVDAYRTTWGDPIWDREAFNEVLLYLAMEWGMESVGRQVVYHGGAISVPDYTYYDQGLGYCLLAVGKWGDDWYGVIRDCANDELIALLTHIEYEWDVT